MEIWDGYLEDGTLSGMDLIRGEQIPEGQFHMVCEALVRHVDGDYLLMLRDSNKETHPGEWEATAGGSALKGEDKLACVKRELQEETGLEAEEFEEIFFEVYRAKNVLFYCFACEVDCDKSSVTLQEGETVDYRWVTEREFIDFVNAGKMIPGQRRRYDAYFRKIGYLKEDEISFCFHQYCRNMDEKKELDRMLLEAGEKEVWMRTLAQRGEKMDVLWKENEDILERIYRWIRGPLSPELAGELYLQLEEMYLNDYDDTVVLDVAKALVQFYEQPEHYNPSNLIRLYGCLDYELNEVWERRSGDSHPDQTNVRKVLTMKKYYSQLEDMRKRRAFFVAYYNIIVTGFANKIITLDEAYNILCEMEEFWNSEEVQGLDGQEEAIRSVVDQTRREWLSVEDTIEQGAAHIQNRFVSLAHDFYNREMETQEEKNCDNDVLTAHLHALVLEGKITWQQACERLFHYYSERVENYRGDCTLGEEELYFLINVPENLMRWMEQGVTEEFRRKVVNAFLQDTKSIFFDRTQKMITPFINDILTRRCFIMMPWLESREEKENWVFHLLVRRQLPTYLHSVMVKNLASEILKEALLRKPELFREVAPDEGTLEDYVEQCALFHDIGKVKITDIINTQARRISDEEFDAIKKHPAYGENLIAEYPEFAKYKDVILGHHRFYNGQGGYPQDYDNTASPYRIVTDLITICDCIDAATDAMGRNYKKGKTFATVLGELVRDKGVRYNPDLVEVLEESGELQDRLTELVGPKRLETAYEIFHEAS